MRFSWTLALIAISFAVFFLEFAVPLEQFAFTPAFAFSRPWTFITSIFMHASYSHIFFNMFALFIFGIYLEARVPQKTFLFTYFLAGIIGNFAYFLTDPASAIPAVGASGAIYGIMGTLAVLFPTLIVYVNFMPMPMVIAAIFWAVLNFLGVFNPSGIAYQAHLGGLFVGVLLGIYLRLEAKRERERRSYRFFFE